MKIKEHYIDILLEIKDKKSAIKSIEIDKKDKRFYKVK